MTKRTRRTHSPGFKAKVALAAIKGEKTVNGGGKTGQMAAQNIPSLVGFPCSVRGRFLVPA